MSWFTNILSGGVDKIVDSVPKGIDSIVTNDEERLQLKNKPVKIQLEAKYKQEEYDVLFPSMRLVTQEEYEADKDLGVNTEMPEWDELEDEYKADLKCPIDYSDNESYMPFPDWLNETRVVSETSYVCDE